MSFYMYVLLWCVRLHIIGGCHSNAHIPSQPLFSQIIIDLHTLNEENSEELTLSRSVLYKVSLTTL